MCLTLRSPSAFMHRVSNTSLMRGARPRMRILLPPLPGSAALSYFSHARLQPANACYTQSPAPNPLNHPSTTVLILRRHPISMTCHPQPLNHSIRQYDLGSVNFQIGEVLVEFRKKKKSVIHRQHVPDTELISSTNSRCSSVHVHGSLGLWSAYS